MREKRGSTQGARCGAKRTGWRAIQIRNFPCGDPSAGELSSPEESRSSRAWDELPVEIHGVILAAGRVIPRARARAFKERRILKDESPRRTRITTGQRGEITSSDLAIPVSFYFVAADNVDNANGSAWFFCILLHLTGEQRCRGKNCSWF